MFLIAEVFRAGQGGQGHTGAGSRRLVHLPVDQGGAFQHAGFLQLVVQVVALTGTLAHTGKHRRTAVLLGDVVDHLHKDNGLAHACATEETHLAALGEGHQQIHHLDARFEQLYLGVLVGEGRRGPVDGVVFFSINGAQLVHRTADDVEDAPHRGLAHGHHDGLARVHHVHAAHQTFGGVHGNGADHVVAQVLRHLTDEVGGVAVVRVLYLQGGEDIRQVPVAELHVHDGADNLNDFTDIFAHVWLLNHSALQRRRRCR